MRTFLKLAISDEMLIVVGNTNPTRSATHLSIANYETYQGDQQTDNTASTREKHVVNTSVTTSKEVKKERSKKNHKNDSLAIALVNTRFEEFWNLYDHKQDRLRCEKLWAKLTEAEKSAIMEHVPRYVASTPDVKYRRHPATYLHNRSWENAIITENRNGNNSNGRTGNSGRHIPSEQLITRDLERRQRLGLDTGAMEPNRGRNTQDGTAQVVRGLIGETLGG
ncbi:MAG: hypothetical protein IPF79_04815 [Ignavibacteria bacterium]|nr:hypothetical protein [Ignavibacteria bacterium]